MTPRSARRLWIALRVTVVAGLVAGFVFLLRSINIDALTSAVTRANGGLVVAAVAVNFLLMGWKALRLRVMLAPVKRIRTLRLFRYTVLSYAASTLLPARAGELLRVWLLARRDGVPVPVAASVAATEKIFDVLGMLMVVAPLPWLLPDLPGWVPRAVVVVGILALVTLGAGWLLLRYTREESWLARFLPGMAVLRRPRDFAVTVFLSLVTWVTDVATLWIVLIALGIHLSLGGILLTMLAINVAIALPSTPAQIGTFELGAVLALDLLGVPRAQALAFALIYHAMQAVPLALIGLAQMRFILGTLRAGKASSEDAPAEAP